MRKEHFCTTETPQTITEISRKCHGKSRKITENHGKSRKGFFMPITEIVESLHVVDVLTLSECIERHARVCSFAGVCAFRRTSV